MPENMISSRRSIHADRESKTPQREQSDEEDEQILSSSQDHFSTESGSDPEGFDQESTLSKPYKRRDNLNISRSVPRTPQRPKPPRLNGYSKGSFSPESLSPNSGQKSSSFMRICILVLMVSLVFGFYYLKETKVEERKCSFEDLQKHYPQENQMLWRSLKVGIELILNRRTQQPAVYLFAHNGSEHVFHLIKNIAQHSSGCFGKQMLPIEMESDDFITASDSVNDYGLAIEKYKSKIKKGNVILIANLNEIPAEAARALHTICDTHSPIAKDVVIFLTLTIPSDIEGNAETKVENTLQELWGPKLERNELDPLITRVTDQVIVLQS